MNVSLAFRSLAAALVLSGLAGLAAPASALEPVHITVIHGSPTEPNLSFDGVHGYQTRFSSDPLPLASSMTLVYILTIEVGPLPAGIYQGTFTFRGDVSTSAHTFRVREPQPGLLFQEPADDWPTGVSIDWKLRSGQTGQGSRVPLTDESGNFWFFDPGDVEVMVKSLDSRVLNGHWWIFLASMTNVELTATLTRCPPSILGAPCFSKQYHIPQGSNHNVIDIQTL